MSVHDYSGIDRRVGRWWAAVGSGLFALGALMAFAASLALAGIVYLVVSYGRSLPA